VGPDYYRKVGFSEAIQPFHLDEKRANPTVDLLQGISTGSNPTSGMPIKLPQERCSDTSRVVLTLRQRFILPLCAE
jgi:hypothetical protein